MLNGATPSFDQAIESPSFNHFKEAYIKTEQNLERFYERMTEFFGAGNRDLVSLPQNNTAEPISKCPACSYVSNITYYQLRPRKVCNERLTHGNETVPL